MFRNNSSSGYSPKISGVIRRPSKEICLISENLYRRSILPAIDAVMNVTQLPATRARRATAVMSGRLEGSIELNAPIIIPSEEGFAKPQIANVVMAELLS